MGYEGAGQGKQVMYVLNNYDAQHPLSWVQNFAGNARRYELPFLDGFTNRENQIIHLRGGGFALLTSTDGNNTWLSTSKTLEGLTSATAQKLAVPQRSYGATVLEDVLDEKGRDVLRVGLSTWPVDSHLSPSQEIPYTPHTHHTSITIDHS